MKKNASLYTKSKINIQFLDVLFGILFTLALISVGLIIAIHARFLYYIDIKWMDIEASSGLPASVIRENYNALIDYCSPFFGGQLVFPSITASATGLSHFAEVKVIFNIFYILAAISIPLIVIIIYIKNKREEYQYLLVSSITTVVLPLFTTIVCAIDFEASFTIFHKIFFKNDDWIFDPSTDPIINILPQSFFLQCAIVIISTILLGSLLLFVFYKKAKTRYKALPLLHCKKNYYY